MLLTPSRPRLIASLLVFCITCCLGSVAARGDLPRPRPTPDKKPVPANKPDQQQLWVSTDDNLKEAHLRIPASALRPGAPGAQPHSDSGMSPARTVIAGIALTAAVTLSGLLLVRGRGGRGRMLFLAGLIVSAGVLASIASADVPRPPKPIPPSSIVVIPGNGLNVPVVVEIVDDGPIQLTLPGSVAGKVPAN